MNQPQELVLFMYPTQDNTKQPVRTHRDDDGNVWFVAKDICDVLEIANSRDAIQGLDDDEKGVATTDTLGGKQKMTVISESGLYVLIFQSRKPEAKRFRKWVTSEVLPQIRKTGSYSMMNLDRCPAGTMKQYKMYRVKTAIATIEAPATATGRKFILEMLEELNIK